MSTERQQAKAEAAAAKARAKSMRPWYRKKRFWLLALIVLIIIAIVASSSGSSDDDTKPGSGSKSHPAAADVTVTSCEKTAIGTAEVELDVTNNSSKRSNYLINITLLDPAGTRVGEANTALNNVEAGQKANDTAVGTITGDPASLTCKVADVTRLASP